MKGSIEREKESRKIMHKQFVINAHMVRLCIIRCFHPVYFGSLWKYRDLRVALRLFGVRGRLRVPVFPYLDSASNGAAFPSFDLCHQVGPTRSSRLLVFGYCLRRPIAVFLEHDR